MSKNDPFEWTLLFCGIAILCFTVFVAIFDKYYSGIAILCFVLFVGVFDKYYSPKLTERDYYNKFCTKHFDVTCDNINLK